MKCGFHKFWPIAGLLMGASIVVAPALAISNDDVIFPPYQPLAATIEDEEPLEFDPDFLRSMLLPGTEGWDPGTMNRFQMIIPDDVKKPISFKDRRSLEDHFTVFVDFFRFFAGYAREFQRDKDNAYGSVGDFRATYIHSIAKKFPNISFQVEAFKHTVENEVVVAITQGGGVGVRVDLHPVKNGTLAFTLLPLYGEKRHYRSIPNKTRSGSDYILRGSAGVSYVHKIGNLQPGFQVLFQPQLVSFGQYRIYAETFVRFKVINRDRGDKRGKVILQDVSIVPKAIYWQTTDREGLLGSSLKELFPDSYQELASHLYAFVNLEFRFRL